MRKASKVVTVIVFLFLYIPIIVLMVASFSSGVDLAVFKEFTFNRYAELFKDTNLLILVRNSAIIAVLSTAVATILGTMAALGIHSMKGRMKSLVMGMTNIPMTNPDIVTGVSLALMFAFTGTILKLQTVLGFWTLLIAHITFNLPYVILNVMPRLAQMDPNLTYAAMDLGCTPIKSFFKVTMHEIMPGIISGALMSFTLSLDDFVISYFVTGNGVSNISILVYTESRRVNPSINALSTLIVVIITVALILVNVIPSIAGKKQGKVSDKEEIPV